MPFAHLVKGRVVYAGHVPIDFLTRSTERELESAEHSGEYNL